MTEPLGSSEARAEQGAAARRRRDLWTMLVLGLVCFSVYNANLRSITAGDTYPARYLPFGILRYRTLLLDPIREVTAQGSRHPFWIVKGRDRHAVSMYPVVVPLLVAPLYLPAAVYLHVRGWTTQRLDFVARLMEKLTASLLAALAVALMYRLLARRAERRVALLLTIAFAFGTNTWMIGSQALWQHGLAELLLVGALLVLTGPCNAHLALAAGILCGLIAANRPPDSLLAAALGVYGLCWWTPRRLAPLLAAGAAIPLGLILAYNLGVVGNVVGAYGFIRAAGLFNFDLLPGVAGLLFSPTRGLFVFSPFLLFLALTLRHRARELGSRRLALLLGIAALCQLLFYATLDWRAGVAWGPRWLTDLLPLLVWMLLPVVAALGRAGRRAFVLTAGAAIAVQAVGAFWYTGSSDAAILAVANGPGAMRAAWDPANAPFIAELRHPPAPRDLAIEVRGNVDRVSAGGVDVVKVTAGTPVVVEGWALAASRSPAVVQVNLDDTPLAATTTFFSRPDVARELHATSPAGWQVVIATDRLVPGEHLLMAAARVSADGELHPLWQGSLAVLAVQPPSGTAVGSGGVPPPPDADRPDAVRRVAALLLAHQQPAGYWLTSYTPAARFENPRREMNTFLTAMMVDLLAPVAPAAGLGASLERARRHLAGQVEASGLVRYHGLPDAPTIPALGCPITPDADDTALVWRIAGRPSAGHRGRSSPSGRGIQGPLLADALAVLARYRTPEGLYRTWLAPTDRYSCIDPGSDPNPADVGIQMHVYLLLARADPPAARALCGALARGIADDRRWVYYRSAPIVPVLRQADLRRAGCALDLPASLLTPVPGQEVWLAAARLLAESGSNSRPALDPAGTAALETLRALAQDDFSLVRRNPPLLYHNDFTAHVPRFYWSEDFGYALWLRLVLAPGHTPAPTRGLPR